MYCYEIVTITCEFNYSYIRHHMKWYNTFVNSAMHTVSYVIDYMHSQTRGKTHLDSLVSNQAMSALFISPDITITYLKTANEKSSSPDVHMNRMLNDSRFPPILTSDVQLQNPQLQWTRSVFSLQLVQ